VGDAAGGKCGARAASGRVVFVVKRSSSAVSPRFRKGAPGPGDIAGGNPVLVGKELEALRCGDDAARFQEHLFEKKKEVRKVSIYRCGCQAGV
jgi:hypothetical protein